jgi:hypothetical protein
MSTHFSSPELYTTQFLLIEGVAVSKDGNLDLKHVPLTTFYARLATKYRSEYQAAFSNFQPRARPPKFSKEELIDALTVVCQEMADKARAGMINQIRCTSGSNLAPLRGVVSALTLDQDVDLITSVLASTLWIAKRHMFNLKPEWHIMPVLFGPQGCGKSHTVRALLKPIQELTKFVDCSSLTDSRWKPMLAQNNLLVMDEMARAAKTEVEELKTIITADLVAHRALHTNTTNSIPIRCAFIGTTNKHLSEIIKDDTGMRRFFEINVHPNLEQLTKVLSETNMVELWRGIDENLEHPYWLEFKKEVENHQRQLVHVDPYDDFLDEMEVGGGKNFVECRRLFADFMIWQKQNYPGYHNLSKRSLGLKLSARHLPSITRQATRGYFFSNETVTNLRRIHNDS